LTTDFKTYFLNIINNSDKNFHNFSGIQRKEFPKWEGWKIINKCKETGEHPKEIEDEELNILVENFHYIQFIQNIK
jgi:hypothetical protein